MDTKKRSLADAIKGMQVESWEVREHSNGRRKVYVRFTQKEPVVPAPTIDAAGTQGFELGTIEAPGGVLTTNDEVEGSAPQSFGAVRVTTAGAAQPTPCSIRCTKRIGKFESLRV